MSERDTLAALLHEACVEAQMGAPMSPGLAAIDADWHRAEADRLIAAGVRLAPADTGLREAAQAVVRQANPDEDFDGQYIEYLVPYESIDALRAALDAEAGR